ncbi:MAG: ABC transporter ATP-binding protein [Campylobacterales bacterium]|nr:ABC transporter ATP-binding protein [Campylobacterales bacterium]
MLKVTNLSHKFDYELFNNISIEINPKDKIAVIGKSGSGKSTLLHILATLLTPQNGEIIYQNQNIAKLSKKEILDIRRYDFGIIFQAHYLFRGFSAMENLLISSMLTNQPIDLELMKRFNISHVLNQNIGELSGGQQQRVSIARVLTKKPKIIFADEPTGNLDQESANDVMNAVFEYVDNNNAALFLVTHDIELAKMCDIVYELKDKSLMIWK